MAIIASHWFHDKSLPFLFAHSGSSSRSTEGPADLVLRSPLNPWPLAPFRAAFWLKTQGLFLFLDWLPLKSFISYLHVFLPLLKHPKTCHSSRRRARNSWLLRIYLGVSFGFVWSPWTPFGQPWLWITCGWVLFENQSYRSGYAVRTP